ncbi:MAG TPA: TraR/DksA C4-type zinc finger protein [Anaeromyxobacteraceae bacterium]|nr:TraR/DksA C4-type zinc finger protein [Anaeromyxobacteraceae bacterium]
MGALSLEHLERFKTGLERSKQRLLSGSRRMPVEDASFDPDDLRDETDAAASEHSQSLLLQLRNREKFLLGKVESALDRLANGSFGTCDRCGQEIPPRRLEVRPVTTLCLDCKDEEEMEERRSFGATGIRKRR